MNTAIEKAANIFKKDIYKSPAPLSELIDSSTYVIDFGIRKFLNIDLSNTQ